jgi:hypothetical protein
MYQIYAKTESGFDNKKLIAEYSSIEKVRERVDAELNKNPELKYIIEETTGRVDIYGELIANVVEEN